MIEYEIVRYIIQNDMHTKPPKPCSDHWTLNTTCDTARNAMQTTPCTLTATDHTSYTKYYTLYSATTLDVVHSTLYALHYTLRTVHHTPRRIPYALHTILYAPYTEHYTNQVSYSRQHAPFTTRHSLNTMHLYAIDCAIYTIHFAPHTKHYTLYTLTCTPYFTH